MSDTPTPGPLDRAALRQAVEEGITEAIAYVRNTTVPSDRACVRRALEALTQRLAHRGVLRLLDASYAAEASDLTVRLMAAEAEIVALKARLICWNHDGIVSLGYVKETEAGPMYTCPQCSASVVRQESPDGE